MTLIQNKRLLIVISALQMLSSVAASGARQSCRTILGGLQNLVSTAKTMNDNSADDMQSMNERLSALTKYFVGKGYGEFFVSRHIVSLVYMGLEFDLLLFDKRSDEFKAFVEEWKSNDPKFLQKHRRAGGLFITRWKTDGHLQFVIALNPDSRVFPFEDAVFEEILHARFSKFHLNFASQPNPRPMPYFMRNEMTGLRELVDEFIVKEIQNKFGKYLESDRDKILGSLLSYAENRPTGIKDFELFVKSMVGCATRRNITWRQITPHAYLNCLIRIINADDLDLLVEDADPIGVRDMGIASLIANQRLSSR